MKILIIQKSKRSHKATKRKKKKKEAQPKTKKETAQAEERPEAQDVDDSASPRQLLEILTKRIEEDDTTEFTNIPYSRTYTKLARFLQSARKQSNIDIPENIAPIQCTKLKNLHIFPTKQKVTPGEDVEIVRHLQVRHPEDLNFIHDNTPDGNLLGGIENVMQQVIENTKPSDMVESSFFTATDGTKIPVNTIKFTADIEINGHKKKATCVFSKPRQETLDQYREDTGDFDANILVARTLYFHDQSNDDDLDAKVLDSELVYGNLQRSNAKKDIGSPKVGSSSKKRKKKKKK